jgi:hypothetical protein
MNDLIEPQSRYGEVLRKPVLGQPERFQEVRQQDLNQDGPAPGAYGSSGVRRARR